MGSQAEGEERMSKHHTPGPWTYKLDEDCRNLSVTTTYAPTEIVGGCGCCDSPWVACEADARLIAAAPDMLEALEKMVGLFEPGRVYDFREISAIGSEALKIALAAIAKAKGEKQ